MKQGMIRFLCLLLLIALVAVACKNDEKTPHGPKKNKETIEKQEQVVVAFDPKIEAAAADYQELSRLLEEKEAAEMVLMDLMEQWESAQG